MAAEPRNDSYIYTAPDGSINEAIGVVTESEQVPGAIGVRVIEANANDAAIYENSAGNTVSAPLIFEAENSTYIGANGNALAAISVFETEDAVYENDAGEIVDALSVVKYVVE
jgi:hypothetical protein